MVKRFFVQDDTKNNYLQGLLLSNYVTILAKEFIGSRDNYALAYQDEIRKFCSVMFDCYRNNNLVSTDAIYRLCVTEDIDLVGKFKGTICPHSETKIRDAQEASCEAGYTGDTCYKVCGEKSQLGKQFLVHTNLVRLTQLRQRIKKTVSLSTISALSAVISLRMKLLPRKSTLRTRRLLRVSIITAIRMQITQKNIDDANKDNISTDSPATWDTSDIILWISLLISGLGILLTIIFRGKQADN